MDIRLKILRSKYYLDFGSTGLYTNQQKMYSWYGKKDDVQNVHLPANKHDFGITKRMPLYVFMAKYLNLNIKAIQNDSDSIDESKITIEPDQAMFVF